MLTQVPLVISSLLCKKSIGKKMSFNFMCTKILNLFMLVEKAPFKNITITDTSTTCFLMSSSDHVAFKMF